MSVNLQEFIVTLKNKDDLDSFYLDMETEGGDLYIPNRAVSLTQRRLMSRNTHYLLTAQEAELLKNDPRVEAVALAEIELVAIRPVWQTENGNFDKSSGTSNSYVNWGLLRCTEGQQRSGWGSDSTANQVETVTLGVEGRNVDVIIADGHFDPDHPEYAVNADGSGGTRAVQFDWYTLNTLVGTLDNDGETLLSGSYVYTPYYSPTDANLTDDNNHGAHVAGTVAGNTQGWARSANIYNISPYGSNPNGVVGGLLMWDYIRAFHRSKTVNPDTGRKNPTVVNCSFGSSLRFPYAGSYVTSAIRQIAYRGITTGDAINAMSTAQIIAGGIYASGGTSDIPYYSSAVAADIQDAIADGIVIIAAAGNEYQLIDELGGADYNNTFIAAYGGVNYQWYPHRGTAPGAAAGVICVGAVGSTVSETKAAFSNCGPRIDIYAPGRYIISSLNYGGISDSRSGATTYWMAKYSGTSMASPQVCGVVACILEQNPHWNQQQVREYLLGTATTGQLGDTAGGAGDSTALQGSPNRYLYLKKERPDTGQTVPKQNQGLRPSTGVTWPRPRIFRYS